MKILIVAHGIPSENDPQWGCFELDQARALKNLGHDVSIMAVDGRYRNYYRKIGVKHTIIDKINLYCVFLFPFGLILGKKIKVWMRQTITLYLFKKVIREQGIPDVIYAHYLNCMVQLVPVRKKYPNIPIVGIEHWSKLNQSELPKHIINTGQIAYSIVDRLLVVSKHLKLQIKKHFGKDAEVVYDMLGQEFVEHKELKEKQNGFRFIAVGSLLPIKDYETLIVAFSRSKLADEGCSLSIVGDGSERSKLENIIGDLNLKTNVLLLGRKTKNEIISILSECHAFVLSSQSETFGVACIEALSQGLPAIVTRCGGPEEFVDDSNGLLVEPHNSDAMAIAMRKIYENYSKYDTLKIAESCRNRFAPDVIAKQLSELMGGGNFQFISIGSLIPRKGFDILISAFAKSELAKKGCRVVIIGEGPEKLKLQKQVQQSGVSNCVQLVGRKSKKEIINLMHESSVFILSSRAETFGVVCIEALSQGLPNIATICGGPEEFINESNGILIPINSIEALTTAMKTIYKNYCMYDNKAIADECKSKFAPHVIAKQLTEIFKNVVK